MSKTLKLSMRLNAIEARLTHLELWMSRSLNQETVYPIIGEMRTLAENVMAEVRDLRVQLGEEN